ncbi:glycosyltransferase family 2 protein [Escherichia coli]|uniref:glycosyltransferase family 2 protein n=1 Tax=Escherichia coli TaxID=562 RepID=UPI001FF43837|nr:glycosyltransferase family 2 protein [Escherichia coli]
MGALVSIIMPSFNSANTICEAIDSVIMQTYNNWELLITDDCSTDTTVSLVKSYCENDDRIKLFQNKINSGAAVSRNYSLENARGEYIAFLDSDDFWFSNKLEVQLEFMKLNRGADFTFTAYELIDASGISKNKFVDLQGENVSVGYLDMLRKKATLGCSTVILKRSAFQEIRMPLLRTGQDYALWLKLLKTGKKAFLINCVLMKYRILPNSISRNKLKKCRRQWQIYRKTEALSLQQSIVSFIFYAWRAVFRR